MKITKRQLRRIIAEEQRLIEAAGSDEWYTDQDETFADYLFRTNTERDEEEEAYFDEMEELEAMREPEAGQDWPKRSGMSRRFKEGITKRQLQRIIREEKTKLLETYEIVADFVRDVAGTDENDYDGLVQYLSHHTGQDEDRAADMVDQMIDDGGIQYDARNDEFYM